MINRRDTSKHARRATTGVCPSSSPGWYSCTCNVHPFSRPAYPHSCAFDVQRRHHCGVVCPAADAPVARSGAELAAGVGVGYVSRADVRGPRGGAVCAAARAYVPREAGRRAEYPDDADTESGCGIHGLEYRFEVRDFIYDEMRRSYLNSSLCA